MSPSDAETTAKCLEVLQRARIELALLSKAAPALPDNEYIRRARAETALSAMNLADRLFAG